MTNTWLRKNIKLSSLISLWQILRLWMYFEALTYKQVLEIEKDEIYRNFEWI